MKLWDACPAYLARVVTGHAHYIPELPRSVSLHICSIGTALYRRIDNDADVIDIEAFSPLEPAPWRPSVSIENASSANR
jgi:hypothetical protein